MEIKTNFLNGFFFNLSGLGRAFIWVPSGSSIGEPRWRADCGNGPLGRHRCPHGHCRSSKRSVGGNILSKAHWALWSGLSYNSFSFSF